MCWLQGGDEVIECRDVSFSYPASGLPDSEKQAEGALKHISCTIEDGSFVLLCGTSGCGKTTMTRLFNGLIPHYHEGTYTGSVYLDGKDTRDLSLFDISLKVGSVFQNPRSQFFNVDTTSELAFGQENRRHSSKGHGNVMCNRKSLNLNCLNLNNWCVVTFANRTHLHMWPCGSWKEKFSLT